MWSVEKLNFTSDAWSELYVRIGMSLSGLLTAYVIAIFKYNLAGDNKTQMTIVKIIKLKRHERYILPMPFRMRTQIE